MLFFFFSSRRRHTRLQGDWSSDVCSSDLSSSATIWAPPTGLFSTSLASKASAGGQLEQPSDVNSSTTTGEAWEAGGLELSCELKALTPSPTRIRAVPPADTLESKVFTTFLPHHALTA